MGFILTVREGNLTHFISKKVGLQFPFLFFKVSRLNVMASRHRLICECELLSQKVPFEQNDSFFFILELEHQIQLNIKM